MKKKVFVGLSGGVDSAVAALLLQKDGFDVTGVFLKNWSGDDFGTTQNCPWEEDLESAKNVADYLGIPLKIYNFEKEYRETVMKDFYYQYSIGNTPNPDVLCNKYIKFGTFLNRAVSEGADYIATGHYVNSKEGYLYKAIDQKKDQTYFLYQLSKENINKSIFPLGNLLKSEVRNIAKANNLPNADRKDSQGICFIGKVDLQDFLKTKLKEQKGAIINIDSNKVVGEHNGIWFYTIGQRHGLGIGGVDKPYFVCQKDVDKNILYVASGEDHPKLFTYKVKLNNVNDLEDTEINKIYTAQTRYHGHYLSIKYDKDLNIVTFIDKAWACAKGQSVVIFDGSKCLGGGNIDEIID